MSLNQVHGLDALRRMRGDRHGVCIVCLGDSITGRYYHTGGRRAYPELLGELLRRETGRFDISVINAGMSGDTAAGGLRRLDENVLSHQPHAVVVMFGMNDVSHYTREAYADNLRQIALRCGAAGAAVIFCTPNNIIQMTGRLDRPPEKLAEFGLAMRELAREIGAVAVDAHHAFKQSCRNDDLAWRLLFSDPIHPNLLGHMVFATRVAEAVLGRPVSDALSPRTVNPLHFTAAAARAGRPIRAYVPEPLVDAIADEIAGVLHGSQAEIVGTWPASGMPLKNKVYEATLVRDRKPDLVLLAPPDDDAPASPAEFAAACAATAAQSLAFAEPLWDCAALMPDASHPLHDTWYHSVVGHDIDVIDAANHGDTDGQVVRAWVRRHLPHA